MSGGEKMKKVYSRKWCVYLVLILLYSSVISKDSKIWAAALSLGQVTSQTEENAQTAFNLSSLNNKQIIGSGMFKAKANEKLIIQGTSTIGEGTVDLFLFDPTGKEIKYTLPHKEQKIEVSLTEGCWAYNCTGFWEGAGKIELIGTLEKCVL